LCWFQRNHKGTESLITLSSHAQEGRGVTSAASFPDGGAARPPTSASSAVDDLLGLENEISAIQVKKIIWVKKRISVYQFNMTVNLFSLLFFSVLFEHLLGRYPSDRPDHSECTTELPD
jgi:hypothetical protein